MELRVWNTLERKKETVRPHHPDGVLRIYNCGPTVYASPHIGNMRRFVVADILARTLGFLGHPHKSIMNITDVGHLIDQETGQPGTDKMVLAAQKEKQTPEEIAAKYTQEFFAALLEMRAEPAHYYPRATMHIPFMIKLILRLIENGVAYENATGIYYDVSKFPSYGKLSGNKVADIDEGARVAVREEKRNPFDFALWIKAPKEHLMQWDSPWGRGYPGWHIECSAMAMHSLGETLDIHTGGIDNLFPHHENEIAQSEGATGKQFAKIWLHNAHLTVDGKKMAKSDGGFITINEIKNKGFDPLDLRLLFLQTHYRSKLNFTWQALEAAREARKDLNVFAASVKKASTKENRNEVFSALPVDLEKSEDKFREALADDLGTPQAVAVIFSLVRGINPVLIKNNLSSVQAESITSLLLEFNRVLAVLDDKAGIEAAIPEEISKMAEERRLARINKDYQKSDELRQKINNLGYDVFDTGTGQQLTRKT